ncbi:uncharacterized protein C5L36_0B05555 [Pichia kudriavzevii]|uniref:Cysteine-rich transmembrane domain-containing protein n=2 Tax=Pichia kudriavzevii TaxID=4909 RepID=A0A2U9R2I0_PICKU|nr:uncharacterized protein C5L36_0B05555 [Pichia kudriavzevii]AWU75309.1 hypothetical protein C5L36_0B05555 [Pichia kudriavzevii]
MLPLFFFPRLHTSLYLFTYIHKPYFSCATSTLLSSVISFSVVLQLIIAQNMSYQPPNGPPPQNQGYYGNNGAQEKGFLGNNQGPNQGYYQQQPPQQQYYQQQPPQQQYYQQQPQPVYVQQQQPQKDNNDCCMACLAALCVCCTLDALF